MLTDPFRVVIALSRKTFAVSVLLLTGRLGAPSLQGEALAFDLDPKQTTITFTLGAFLHTVHGTFRLKYGEVRFDPETGRSSGEVVVDLTTGATGNSSRDRKMHEEVLESQRFPEAVFSFDRVEGHFSLQGESEGDLHGRIRIHGTERELVVHVRAQVKDGEAKAAGRFEIPYVKWGMKDPSTALLSVKDRVTVEVRTTLLRAVRTSRRTGQGTKSDADHIRNRQIPGNHPHPLCR